MADLLDRINSTIRKRSDFRKTWKKAGLEKVEYFKLLRLPGGYFQPTTIQFRGYRTHFTSPYWFLHSIREIFVDEVYRYSPSAADPLIIDCGANIGLSVVYFKELCPGARIVAFEPDPEVFSLLRDNVEERKLSDLTLYNAAAWIDESILVFDQEGALGGKVVASTDGTAKTVAVNGRRLRDLLNEPVDFLKLDIEGAEHAVLEDCRDKLSNVNNLFIEYHSNPLQRQRLNEILTWVTDAGFRYYVAEAAPVQPRPFISKGVGNAFDLQLNISCYRPEVGRTVHA